VTLVRQSLLLPWLMRALGVIETGRHEHDTARAEEYLARQRAIKATLERLDRLSQEGRFAAEVLEGIRAQYQIGSELSGTTATPMRTTESSARSKTKSSWR
jgi:hypothetical protein